MPAPIHNQNAAKPPDLSRTRRIMLNFTPVEKSALNHWAAGEKLTEKMRRTVLDAANPSLPLHRPEVETTLPRTT